MKIYAIYRMYYGEDFIEASIKSIYDHVDKIFVFLSTNAYANVKHGRVDRSDEVVAEMDDPDDKLKLFINDNYTFTPKNQFTDLYNTYIYKEYEIPDAVMCIEHDMVWEPEFLNSFIHEFEEFEEKDYCFLNSGLVEFWHNDNWMIPFRQRKNCILHKLNTQGMMYKTMFSGEPIAHMDQSRWPVYNYGYCMKPHNMKVKFELSVRYANIIGDSIPYNKWFEEVWYNWHPELNNKNLEISAHYRHYITHAYKADITIPKVLKNHEWNPDTFIQAQE